MSEFALNGRPRAYDTDWVASRNFVSVEQAKQAIRETGAHQWIRLMASRDHTGKLSVDGTAENIGVPVSQDFSTQLKGSVEGLEWSDLNWTEIKLSSMDDRVTFGHEVGHIFYSLVLSQRIQYGESVDEELFCDVFGYEMAVPESELEELGTIDEDTILRLSNKFGIHPRSAIFRLMLAEKIPSKVNVDAMFGVNQNPQYDRQIVRTSLCLNCDQLLLCDDEEPTVVFDFTDHDFAASLQNCRRVGPRAWFDESTQTAVRALYNNRQMRLFDI